MLATRLTLQKRIEWVGSWGSGAVLDRLRTEEPPTRRKLSSTIIESRRMFTSDQT
jgi:hypothetical protein